MSQQHQKWIQLVKDKLNSEGMTQTHLARACGVKKLTISELRMNSKTTNPRDPWFFSYRLVECFGCTFCSGSM